ncbi:MAG: ABC transporter ATP-binding protein [Nocardioides sp.]|uniref:ABC transporter ATP-binding protein n=1 Tax=Nocardioides sp. TaxID=35761 RepID=UPI0039E275A6
MSAAIAAHEVSWGVRRRPILRAVDLVARPGLVTGLLGPNGSGKSSLLRVLAGLVRPDAGVVRIAGRDVHRMRARERARSIALVEQDAVTGWDLSVREVVELGRVPYRSRFATGDAGGRDAVDSALALAQVAGLAERRWRELSGGERQRTHLARSLAQQPEILLLDEPTNHLDLGHQIDFLAKVRRLGLTVVAALHDLELAAAYCDDLIVLDAGRIVAAGAVERVLTPELIAAVYGVDATVEPHPTRSRPHVRWNGVIG